MEIRDSVGDPKEGAANRGGDVKTAQGLLNIQMAQNGRCDRLLTVTGSLDRDTLKAIIEFQRRRAIAQSGLIIRGDATYRDLVRINGPRTLRASQRFIDWLKKTEALRLHLYDNDGAGNTTIGWGHFVPRGRIDGDPSENPFKHGITEEQAGQLLRDDLRGAEDEVNGDVRVPLNQNQFDALVSLEFNIGPSHFRGSHLLKLLNAGDYLGAARQFEVWRNMRRDGHLVHSRGLIERRKEEEQRFRRC
jgi:lysozyme